MSIGAFLEGLRQRDIEVWTEGDALRCKAPAGAIDPSLREELRQRKTDIVAFLDMARALSNQQPAIVPLQRAGGRPPIFAVPGHSGDVFCFRALSRHLGEDQPFFGLQPPGLDGTQPPLASVEALATYYATQIAAVQGTGACVVAGYCAGGTVAFELGRQLLQRGVAVDFVAIFGSPYPSWYRPLPQLRERLVEQGQRLKKHLQALCSPSWPGVARYIAGRWQDRQTRQAASRHAADTVLAGRAAVEAATLVAMRCYSPRPFAGQLAVFLPSEAWQRPGNRLLGWPKTLAKRVEEYCGPTACNGFSMLLEPHAAAFAELFRNIRSA
jgi:thioesterase domain-containing protein